MLSEILTKANQQIHSEFIDIKAITSFLNRLRSCVAAAGGHYEHLFKY